MKKAVKIVVAVVALVVASFIMLMFFIFQKKEKSPAPQPQTGSPKQQQAEGQDAPQTSAPETAAVENANPPTSSAPVSDPLPAKFLLPIPFHSQSPFGNWDKVHEEMCEEASVLNAGLYLLGEKPSKDAFEKELMNFKKLEEKELGDYKSNTITEIKKAADIYFAGKINSKIIMSPTIEDIETEIVAGHPVIVPLAGRDIGNPNFTPPGPVYHMLVVKGYDAQNFITNDVGTRKGESYTYKKETIMKNMHDWNQIDIHRGTRKILIFYK